MGFLAPDFLDSAAARFYDVFFDLPRRAFTLHAYSLAAEEDALTASVRARTAAYRVLAGEGIAAADIVRADRLDVLVDLGGHTAGGVTLPLLARRLAPVQLEAVGWFDTTGVPAVDALLTDGVMDGAGAARLFTERLCRLPRAWCFTPTDAGRSYYEFRAGPVWGLSLDTGEDKVDGCPEYGHTVCCEAFREEEEAWLRGIELALVTCLSGKRPHAVLCVEGAPGIRSLLSACHRHA